MSWPSTSSGNSDTSGGIAAARDGCWRSACSPRPPGADAGARRRAPRRRPDWRRRTAISEQAVSLDEQALEIYEQLDDPVRSANALVFLGTLYQAVGRADGRETLERGLARLQEAGDEYGATIAMGNLSHLALEDGDFATSARLSEQAAARAREHGFELIEAMATCNQAVALVHEDDQRADSDRYLRASAVRADQAAPLDRNLPLRCRGSHRGERARRAAVLLGAAEAELQGARMDPAETAVHENATTTVRAALGATEFEQSLEEGRMLGRDAAVALALGSSD